MGADAAGPGALRRLLEEVIVGGPPGEESYGLQNLGDGPAWRDSLWRHGLRQVGRHPRLRPDTAVYYPVYTRGRRAGMKTARVFRSGNSQAVRIPKEFRIEGDEVEILRKGKSLVLRPRRRSWASLVRSLERFTDDFMGAGRHQGRREKRGRAFP